MDRISLRLIILEISFPFVIGIELQLDDITQKTFTGIAFLMAESLFSFLDQVLYLGE